MKEVHDFEATDGAPIPVTDRAQSNFGAVILGLGIGVGLLLGSARPAQADTTNTYPFAAYTNRTALLNGGWSFWATNSSGTGRNTEITDTNLGPTLVYNPPDHPEALRIPADTGNLLLAQNDSRNSLFRELAPNWVSLRLKVKFAVTQSYQQVSLMVYAHDDNFVTIGHLFSGNERVILSREFTGWLLDNQYQTTVLNSPLPEILLRLERDPETDRISGSFSADGITWTNVGNFSQSFSQPRLGIYAGGSTGGFPNCDLIQLEVVTQDIPVPPALVVPVQQIVFNIRAGQWTTNQQAIPIALRSQQSAPGNWTLTNSAPGWLGTSQTNGITPDTCQVALQAATTNLAPGTYEAVLGFHAPGATAANMNVTLIVNPANRVRVATWQGGKKGAMSVSVDDSKTSGYFELVTNGLHGSFMLMQGAQAPVFTELYQAGMELGAHTLSHPCEDVGAPTMRGEIEGNRAGILASTPVAAADLISLAWPCGVATAPYRIVAADYFLAARSYNLNQLEEATPNDFMNLKSFNSHEHPPFPPADLKTLVDAAAAQGKWCNLVLHNLTNDDGAITHAAGQDVWVAPLGSVVKYIHQRDRTVITNYIETAEQIQFETYRRPLNSSAYRSFETAFGPADRLTFQVEIPATAMVTAVTVAGIPVSFTSGGNTLLFQTRVTTNAQNVVLMLGVGAPRFASITRTPGGAVHLQCEVQVGRTYAFHYKNNLTDPVWIPFITNYTASAASVNITNATGTNPQRFYRAADVTGP
jgi:regulation of enolase protein 1 (concanavalin A-like superfamily)